VERSVHRKTNREIRQQMQPGYGCHYNAAAREQQEMPRVEKMGGTHR
jgi:hypothetical protein